MGKDLSGARYNTAIGDRPSAGYDTPYVDSLPAGKADPRQLIQTPRRRAKGTKGQLQCEQNYAAAEKSRTSSPELP